jgi:predicted MFS family arabinose efflux permease
MATSVLIGDKTGAMGSVMALLTVAHSMGILAGSMLAGLMMDLFRLRAAFPLGTALMLAGIVAFTYATRFRQVPPTNSVPGHAAGKPSGLPAESNEVSIKRLI